jgi:hypothetical protein
MNTFTTKANEITAAIQQLHQTLADNPVTEEFDVAAAATLLWAAQLLNTYTDRHAKRNAVRNQTLPFNERDERSRAVILTEIQTCYTIAGREGTFNQLYFNKCREVICEKYYLDSTSWGMAFRAALSDNNYRETL